MFFAALLVKNKKVPGGMAEPKGGAMHWYRQRWFMLFQYPVVAVLAAILTDITQAAGIYCDFESKPYFAMLWVSTLRIYEPMGLTDNTDKPGHNSFPNAGYHECTQVLRGSEGYSGRIPSATEATGLQTYRVHDFYREGALRLPALGACANLIRSCGGFSEPSMVCSTLPPK